MCFARRCPGGASHVSDFCMLVLVKLSGVCGLSNTQPRKPAKPRKERES